jgi:hypothetical protein
MALVTFLESVANWKPGTPRLSLLFGVPEYLRSLRFSRIELEGPNRSVGGRPAQYDWEDAKLYFLNLVSAAIQ